MLAYAHAYDARRVILLYPWHPGLPAPGIYRRWSIAAGLFHASRKAVTA